MELKDIPSLDIPIKIRYNPETETIDVTTHTTTVPRTAIKLTVNGEPMDATSKFMLGLAVGIESNLLTESSNQEVVDFVYKNILHRAAVAIIEEFMKKQAVAHLEKLEKETPK
jgi:hypothetical protein